MWKFLQNILGTLKTVEVCGGGDVVVVAATARSGTVGQALFRSSHKNKKKNKAPSDTQEQHVSTTRSRILHVTTWRRPLVGPSR